jgi:aminopeptidase N
MFELREAQQSYSFDGLSEEPTPSLLRGFSAPVKLSYDYSEEQLLHLVRYDGDGFNRWDAAQRYLVNLMQSAIAAYPDKPAQAPDQLISSWRELMADTSLDAAMLAKLFTLPSEAYLSELAEVIEVEAIHSVRDQLRKQLATALESEWIKLYKRLQSDAPYAPTAEQIAARSLKNLSLGYLLATGKAVYAELASQQFANADNLTDEQAALSMLVHSEHREAAADALTEFRERWQDQALVMNSWFSIQASESNPGALERIRLLEQDPLFDAKNPNKLRSLIGVFAGTNPTQFHAEDGSGYAYLGDWIIRLNEQNPQVASRLLTPLTRWKRYPESKQVLMREQLQRLLAEPKLSPDVYEVVSKSLA